MDIPRDERKVNVVVAVFTFIFCAARIVHRGKLLDGSIEEAYCEAEDLFDALDSKGLFNGGLLDRED